MGNDDLIIKKGVKFYFLEFIGSLVLFVFLGFPFWMPLIFIVNDMMANNNPLIMYIVGNKGSAMVVAETIIKYSFYFIPSAVLLYWYKTSDEKKNNIIDFMISSDDEYKTNISWKAKGITGNPSNNKKWVSIKPGVMTFKSTHKYQVFTYPVFLVGLVYSLTYAFSNGGVFYFFMNYGFLTLVAALMINGLFYIFGLSGLVVSINKGIFQVGVDTIKIEQVEAIQVLRKRQSHSDGGELYNVYEANIIYLGGQRYNFLNHGDLFELTEQIKQINKYLSVKVVVDENTIDDIKKHNQEAIFKK
ncbi:hypothetical protein ACU6U9_21865 [Pseudomonas sp. HK3]